jgi:hypothetical protein
MFAIIFVFTAASMATPSAAAAQDAQNKIMEIIRVARTACLAQDVTKALTPEKRVEVCTCVAGAALWVTDGISRTYNEALDLPQSQNKMVATYLACYAALGADPR